MKYPLIAIKCGDDASGMWVGLRYRSKDGDQHDLYIVGGEEASVRPVDRTLVPIYFERDDQSLSCYAGATKILVADSSVTLALNKSGQVSLELPKTVQFIPAKLGRDFHNAKTMFTKMKKRHGGKVIDVA